MIQTVSVNCLIIEIQSMNQSNKYWLFAVLFQSIPDVVQFSADCLWADFLILICHVNLTYWNK